MTTEVKITAHPGTLDGKPLEVCVEVIDMNSMTTIELRRMQEGEVASFYAYPLRRIQISEVLKGIV